MILPGFPTITRDEEAEVYARAAKRFRQRRAITRLVDRCLKCIAAAPAVVVVLVIIMEAR